MCGPCNVCERYRVTIVTIIAIAIGILTCGGGGGGGGASDEKMNAFGASYIRAWSRFLISLNLLFNFTRPVAQIVRGLGLAILTQILTTYNVISARQLM